MGITFRNICQKYHDKVVLNQIHGIISPGDKIGLVGYNGVGKSTLAKIISRTIEPDSGQVEYAPHQLLVVYLQQYPNFTPGLTVYEELRQALQATVSVQAPLDALVRKNLNQHEIFEHLWKTPVTDLSGGEKTKLMLCKAFAQDFDLLILDEPTNHLDAESTILLEHAVKRMKQSVLLISHNRYLLNQLTKKTWELSATGLQTYKGNYDAYKTQKELEIDWYAKEYKKQQLRINQIKQDINRRRVWLASATKKSDYKNTAKAHASTIQAKEKELARLGAQKIEKPRPAPVPAFDFISQLMTPIHKTGQVVIQAKHITKTYGENAIFSNVSFSIEHNNRIALLGRNGSGKSSLLRMICGIDTAYQGELHINPALQIGYLSQELMELDQQSTVLESVSGRQSPGNIRTLLACMLFRKNEVFKRIHNLSMGEKSRVAFVRLLLSGANFLVLDEPTNYYDFWAKERMENVLEKYTGGLLFVTHDLYFVQKVANKIMQLENGVLKYYPGNYSYYATKRQQETPENVTSAHLSSQIQRLECDLAYLAGKLGETRVTSELAILRQQYDEKATLLHALRYGK